MTGKIRLLCLTQKRSQFLCELYCTGRFEKLRLQEIWDFIVFNLLKRKVSVLKTFLFIFLINLSHRNQF